MSLFIYLNGVDIGNTRVRLRGAGEPGISGLTGAADGTGSMGGVIFDDPLSNMTVTGSMPFNIDEPDSAPRRRFRGYMGDRTYRHKAGKQLTGLEREIDTTIYDQNAVLSMRLIDGADGNRPAETHLQRIDWLLASSYLSGLISDLGLVDRSGGAAYGAADYRGQNPNDVLNSIAGPIGQIFFAYYDQTAQKLG